jgi:hypothetical protein
MVVVWVQRDRLVPVLDWCCKQHIDFGKNQIDMIDHQKSQLMDQSVQLGVVQYLLSQLYDRIFAAEQDQMRKNENRLYK